MFRLSRLVSAALVSLVCAAPTPASAGSPFVHMGSGPGFLYHFFSEAIPNSFSAGGIVVHPGTYHECVNVTGFVLYTITAKKGAILDATGCDAGITISDGEGITVKGLTIIGAKQGIVVKPAAKRVLLKKDVIQDPAADPQLAVMETGVAVEGAADVTLDGVTIRGAATQAVHVISATGTTVRKCTLADGVGDGVVVDLGANAIVEKNVITNLGGPGVLFFHNGIGAMGGAVDSLVSANKIFANPAGISIGGVRNVIEKNKLTDVGGVAVQAANGSGSSTYRKNTIVRATDAAIYAGGSLDTFEKNTVKEPLAIGVDVAGSDNTFLGGKVSESVGAGWRIRPGASGNHFEGAAAAKAGGAGFDVEGIDNVFVKAKASGSGGLDLDDAAGASTSNTYTDCKFKTSNVN
jgi:parallel beta helix pectate lyase-like protein